MLIARRIPFVTFKVLSTCGVVFHQNHNQLLPEVDRELAEKAKDKLLLGYHDIRVGNHPDNPLIKFIATNLPQILPHARDRFDEYKDLLPVPKQRNSGDDNARIKEGETPEGWENQPAKRSQKDTDARWTKKHGKSHYGYKNHVNVDRRHKLVRRYQVTDAAVHDSQVVDDILDPDNTASEVWADSAYRSAEIEAKLKEKGLKSRIHRKGYRNKPLSEREKRGNTTRSKVRARVEHVFGAQSNDMGGTLVRSIGMVRARARIGLKNLAYNMRRLVQLERLATAPT